MLCIVLQYFATAQHILVIDSSQKNISYRSLSVVNDQLLWVGGNKGTIGKSINGGKTFKWMHPKGFENRDFRDIEAFDADTALVMAIDRPAVILKTTDGGEHWKTVYEKDIAGIFLDAMCFRDHQNGVCVGDPIDRKFWLIETNDGGNTWQEVAYEKRPFADSGEACFASSGSNIQFINKNIGGYNLEYGFVTGGMNSRLFIKCQNKTPSFFYFPLNILHGWETAGANSWTINDKSYVIAGGDFKNAQNKSLNVIIWPNITRSYKSINCVEMKYKSCITWMDKKQLIAVGLSGIDIGSKRKHHWKHISDTPFHVVQKAKHGNVIFLAGPNGKIARLKK